MVLLDELPIGLKGGFLDIKNLKIELNQYWLVLPIKVTEDVDYASAECYDVNYEKLPDCLTLARVKTPLFRNHYVIYGNGKVLDYSMFFEDVSKFEVVEVIPRRELYRRDHTDYVLFGFPVTYRLYKEKETNRKHLVGITPYLDGIEISITTYVGNGEVIKEYSMPIKEKVNRTPIDIFYEEIVERETYNLEKIIEDIKSFLK